MYFWNIKGLTSYIQNDQLKFLDVLLYTILLSTTFLCGINVMRLLSTLYSITFMQAKIYLATQVKPAPLEVIVYDKLKDFFILINFFIVAIGLIFSFFVHRGSLQQFFKHVVALSWPITFRLIIISFFLFCLIVGAVGLYFLYQLLLISKYQGPKGPLPLRPLKMIFKLTGTYPQAKNLWIQAHALPMAQKIFDQINIFSFYTYWCCMFGTVFSTMWWMLTLQEKVRAVSKKSS